MEIRPADRCGRNRPRETLGTMASAKWLWSGWQIQLSRSGRQNKGGSLWTQKRLAERMLRGGRDQLTIEVLIIRRPPPAKVMWCDVQRLYYEASESQSHRLCGHCNICKYFHGIFSSIHLNDNIRVSSVTHFVLISSNMGQFPNIWPFLSVYIYFF